MSDHKSFWTRGKRLLVVFFTVIGIIAGVLLALGSWVSVGVGYGLLIVDAQTHSVSDAETGPIAGFKINPFSRVIGTQYPIVVYYQTDSVSMWTEYKEENGNYIETARGDYPAITVLSKDGLSIEVDIQVRWSLNPAALKQAFQTYPNLNWKDITINSIIREKVRDTMAQFAAIQVIEQREAIATVLNTNIHDALLAEGTLKNLLVSASLEIDLRSIDPSVDFVHAIERKLAAEQAMIQAQFEYDRTLINANATAQAQIIIANGTRAAVQQILEITGPQDSSTIAQLYLTLEAYKTIAPNTQAFIVSSGQTPFVYPLPTNSTTNP